MIIKRFEEQVERFPKKLAVKSGNRSLTYIQLNQYANRVANEIMTGDSDKIPGENSNNSVVSLLFGHDSDAIVGIIGALKANKIYVPLDVNHPQKRLLYMLEHSDSSVLLTNNKNRSLAESLARQSAGKIRILTIDDISPDIPGSNIEREVSEDRPAYILYTSGSTGHPKGVVQNHQNILYFIRHWTQRFSITTDDRITLLASLSHDGAVPDIYGSLLNGAALYPYDIKEKVDMTELERWLAREKITIWHSVPTFYRYFTQLLIGQETFPHLRLVVLGGEEVRKHDVMMFKSYFPNSIFANIYGQTESTVTSIWLVSQPDSFEKVIIGEPIDKTEIVLVDDNGDIVEEMGIGEIVIASEHVAPGYWKDKKSTEEVFTYDEELGRLYWSGDLGRLTADSSIVIEGRKDFQTKIRGFRVEIGEIESVLLQHEAVKEAVTFVKEDENGDNYLCAYVVMGEPTSSRDLREYLATELPDYMIPRHFISLEKMPLTPNGKIDRNSLPEPDSTPDAAPVYEAPRSEIEKKLTAIWQEVLAVEKIGINDHFIELGGHSLLVISVISKIHQEFNVELQLQDVFDNPTVKELSQVIATSKEELLYSIEPGEKKEYYELSSAQKGLYILQQMGANISYNLPNISVLDGKVDKAKIEETFRKLIKRHEGLRTAFELIEEEPIQRIYNEYEVTFQIDHFEEPEEKAKELVKGYIKSFDLSKAPLFRVGLIHVAEEKHILMLDMHHIISDGRSIEIFVQDFLALCGGGELSPLKLQYKDYSEWKNSEAGRAHAAQQEQYWRKVFKSEIPRLNMPTDHPRPPIQRFEGRVFYFEINNELTAKVKRLVSETETTVFVVLLAVYNIMLSKYTRQQDIVVGSPVIGRRRTDLQNIIGIFVNMIAVRNRPERNKKFIDFLQEVRKNAFNAFENQDCQFEELVERLGVERIPGRNPLFDVVFDFTKKTPGKEVNDDFANSEEDDHLRIYSHPYEFTTSKFDFLMGAVEGDERIFMHLEYAIALFDIPTIEKMVNRYIAILEQVVENREILLKEIRLSHDLLAVKSNLHEEDQEDFEL